MKSPASLEREPVPPVGDDAPAGAARRRGGMLLRLAVSGLLLAVVLRRADTGEIFAALRGVDLRWLAAAYALHLVGFTLASIRWQGLLAARGARVGRWPLIVANLVAKFFNFFLPTTVGGDLVRAGEGADLAGRSLTESLGIVTADRLAGVISLLLLALAASALGLGASTDPALFWGSLLVGAAGLTALVFISSPRLLALASRLSPGPLRRPVAKVAELLGVFRSLAADPAVAARAVGVSFMIHLNVVVHYYFIARALAVDVPFLHFFIVVPIVMFILQVPVSLNGIGYREGSFALLLRGVGVTAGQAVALAWLDLAMVLTLGVAGGAVFLLRGGTLPHALARRRLWRQ